MKCNNKWEPLKPYFGELPNLKLEIKEVIQLQELMMLKVYKISKALEKLEDEGEEGWNT